MVPTVPAFGGVPAGPELVIILMILVLLFGVPTVVIAGVVLFLKLRSDGEEADTDRIAGAGGGGRTTPREGGRRTVRERRERRRRSLITERCGGVVVGDRTR